MRYMMWYHNIFSSLTICEIIFALVLYIRLFRFVFAIIADDSSVVYYKMSAGLVPPAPPEMLEEKKRCRQRQFQLRSKHFVTPDEAAALTANFVSSNNPSSQDNTWPWKVLLLCICRAHYCDSPIWRCTLCSSLLTRKNS